MSSERHDLQKDVGTSHAPPEGGALDHHVLSASPMDGAGGGQSRPAPPLKLDAEEGPPGKWRGSPDGDRPVPKAEPEAVAYRARMLAKVGSDQGRTIDFTDEELGGFISHAKGLGFDQEDIEAILAVKVRKPSTKVIVLKSVAECLAKKREDKRIRFKEGWNFMRAYREAQEAMLDGNVLEPEMYLAADYIDHHRKEFTGKASYLLPGERFDRYVNPETTQNKNLGYMGALYVSSPQEIDRVLATAQGDIVVVEGLLGITPGSWQGLEGLWRVDIAAPETKGLHIPHGFEVSANEFWTPGALTSGGTMEAVLDEVPRIEGNYTFKKVID